MNRITSCNPENRVIDTETSSIEQAVRTMPRGNDQNNMGVPPLAHRKIRQIAIYPVMNGFTVTIGCQALVFETSDYLCRELKRYLDKPIEVEKEYTEKYGPI